MAVASGERCRSHSAAWRPRAPGSHDRAPITRGEEYQEVDAIGREPSCHRRCRGSMRRGYRREKLERHQGPRERDRYAKRHVWSDPAGLQTISRHPRWVGGRVLQPEKVQKKPRKEPRSGRRPLLWLSKLCQVRHSCATFLTAEGRPQRGGLARLSETCGRRTLAPRSGKKAVGESTEAG